ncbi:S41 family peptidase [Catenovulum sediminis]|uniref:S41 family peptidase n=1 Tax=Catenovulum sediminis TaxID=1740262 RepID=A0ABV1RCI8_9ALTE
MNYSNRNYAFILCQLHACLEKHFQFLGDAHHQVYLDKMSRLSFMVTHKNLSRVQFTLAVRKVLSALQRSHIEFIDVYEQRMQSLGVICDFLGAWRVTESFRQDVQLGDVLSSIDGIPAERWLAMQARYVSSSNPLNLLNILFFSGGMFKAIQSIEFIGPKGKKYHVKPINLNCTAKAISSQNTNPLYDYYKISRFLGGKCEDELVQAIKSSDKNLIIDIRNNVGGVTPFKLIQCLLESDRFPTLSYSTNTGISALEAYTTCQSSFIKRNIPVPAELIGAASASLGEQPLMLVKGQDVVKFNYQQFSRKILCVVNQNTYSAAEDFAYALQYSGRARLIGTTTHGSTGQPLIKELGDGFVVRVPVQMPMFPDMSVFEGQGLKPDIAVQTKPDDLALGIDTVLEEAVRAL